MGVSHGGSSNKLNCFMLQKLGISSCGLFATLLSYLCLFLCNLQASLEELVQGGPSAASSLTTYDEAALCSSAFR